MESGKATSPSVDRIQFFGLAMSIEQAVGIKSQHIQSLDKIYPRHGCGTRPPCRQFNLREIQFKHRRVFFRRGRRCKIIRPA